MALIVEDGTGLANAEAYCSVAEAAAYHNVRRNLDAWADVEDKEAALRIATDYLEAMYSRRWRGYRATSTQILSWPRRDVPIEDGYEWYSFVPYTTIPVSVKRANAELALISVSQTLMPNLKRANAAVTIGPISVTYDGASSESPRFPMIDGMLAQYLLGGGAMTKLTRS